jgi:hypothetical protein
VRTSTVFFISGLVLWALLLPMAVLVVLITVWAIQAGGHLPWPLALWALTSPAGLVLLLAVCVGIGAPTYIMVQRRFVWGRTLARAVDVTEVPPGVWLTRPPVFPSETRADRWLGRSRRARMVSLMLLGGVLMLLLLLVVSFLTAVGVILRSIPHPPCGAGECAPTYPLIPLVLASEWVIIGLSSVAQSRWLRRVEASSGVWLRYRDWFGVWGVCYIRQLGVTPEAAAAAFMRYAPSGRLPLARVGAIAVLGTFPLVLVLFSGAVLQFWLQTQWLPG